MEEQGNLIHKDVEIMRGSKKRRRARKEYIISSTTIQQPPNMHTEGRKEQQRATQPKHNRGRLLANINNQVKSKWIFSY